MRRSGKEGKSREAAGKEVVRSKRGRKRSEQERREAEGSYERISFGCCVNVSTLVLPWQSICACVCTCMHVCMHAPQCSS